MVYEDYGDTNFNWGSRNNPQRLCKKIEFIRLLEIIQTAALSLTKILGNVLET